RALFRAVEVTAPADGEPVRLWTGGEPGRQWCLPRHTRGARPRGEPDRVEDRGPECRHRLDPGVPGNGQVGRALMFAATGEVPRSAAACAVSGRGRLPAQQTTGRTRTQANEQRVTYNDLRTT